MSANNSCTGSPDNSCGCSGRATRRSVGCPMRIISRTAIPVSIPAKKGAMSAPAGKCWQPSMQFCRKEIPSEARGPGPFLHSGLASSQNRKPTKNRVFILFSNLKFFCELPGKKPVLNAIFCMLTDGGCRNNVISRSKKSVSRKADPPEGNDRLQKAEKPRWYWACHPDRALSTTVLPLGWLERDTRSLEIDATSPRA